MENVKTKIEAGKKWGRRILEVLVLSFVALVVTMSLYSIVFGEGVRTVDYIKSQYEQIQKQRNQLTDKENVLCEEAKTTIDEKMITMLQNGEINRDEITANNELIKEGDCTKIFDKLFQMAEM